MIVNRYRSKYQDMGFLKRTAYGLLHPAYVSIFRSERMRINAYTRKVKSLNGIPHLNYVEIESINRCNGSCSFCPVNYKIDQRKMMKMPEELFIKICHDLKMMNYKNNVSLSSNNEPFLDSRITELAKIARSILPDCTIFMYTNGTLVDRDKIKDIMQYLSYIIIDNYNNDLEINDNIKDIVSLCEEDEDLNQRIQIHLRKRNETLSSRGGSHRIGKVT